MPKISYQDRNFSESSVKIIEQANVIITDYSAQGFRLTLRQLYYQFVSKDLIKNNQKEYKRLGSVINDARLAGLIDWEAIEDRTRSLKSLSHWDSPKDILDVCSQQYRIDKWATQKFRPEIWIEKEALAGIFEGVCHELDVPYFCCRGYTSQSEMWAAAMRLEKYIDKEQTPIIFHFGDHDPSGIDMTRDIRDRLEMFMGGLELQRLALNMDQVDQYSPPPNPAKATDARFSGYIKTYGDESWELDALEPSVLANLVRNSIDGIMDNDAWDKAEKREKTEKTKIAKIAKTI